MAERAILTYRVVRPDGKVLRFDLFPHAPRASWFTSPEVSPEHIAEFSSVEQAQLVRDRVVQVGKAIGTLNETKAFDRVMIQECRWPDKSEAWQAGGRVLRTADKSVRWLAACWPEWMGGLDR